MIAALVLAATLSAPLAGASPTTFARQEQDSGEESGDRESFVAEILDHSVHDHDECASRSADLTSASSQEGDEEAPDDRRVEPLFRLHPGCDRERQGKRQRDDADDDAGKEVLTEPLPGVPLLKDGPEFGDEA